MRACFAIAAASLVAATGCRPSRDPGEARAVPVSTLAAELAAQHKAEYRREAAAFATAHPEEPRTYHVLSYAIKGSFAWETSLLTATMTVTLQLDPGAAPQILLDSQLESVDQVTVAGGGQLPFTVDRPAETMTIDASSLPPATLAAPLTLVIAYKARANDTGAGEADYQVDSFRAVPARAGDPAASRALNTMSEPLGAHLWMPCHDDPADRATFAIELAMPDGDSFVANGDLVKDVVDPVTHVRTMGYATRNTLPTYLMAFAEGQFVTATVDHKGLPVSVWARQGMQIDFQGVLAQLERQIDLYESKLFPFPFEKYAVVFLPEFQSGEEHASVTFQREIEGTNPHLEGDLALLGHELSHQWFGDYMTVRAWDDLWVKEGMATLLEIEQLRPYIDGTKAGGLNAGLFTLAGTDSIIDKSLDAENKYTTGPYGRSAWLITQLRGLLGEDQFWSILRGVLKAHAWGTISGDEFLAAFRPAVGDEVWAKATAALTAHKMPVLAVTPVAASPAQVTVTLTDPEGSLIAPMHVRTYKDLTTYQEVLLASGASATLTADPAQPLVVIDPQDVEPLATMTTDVGALSGALAPWVAPHTDEARATFATLTASAQQFALSAAAPWLASAADFAAIYPTLGSDQSRLEALRMGCDATLAPGLAVNAHAAWQDAVTKQLLAPPDFGIYSWYVAPNIARCGAAATPGEFAADLARLAMSPGDPSMSEPQLLVLGRLGLDPAAAFQALSAVATGGPSVRLRADAVVALTRYLTPQPGFSKPAVADLPAWKAFFRGLLTDSHVGEVVVQAVAASLAAGDVDALPQLKEVALGGTNGPTEQAAVCAAYQLTMATPAAWQAWVASLGPVATLPNIVAMQIATPQTCVPGA